LGDFFPEKREAFSGRVLYREYPHPYTEEYYKKGPERVPGHGGFLGPGRRMSFPGQVSL
jgi:hypothetical protein